MHTSTWWRPGTTLPDKPSDLLELALHDLELCEADGRYEIRMLLWHAPLDDRPGCMVCLAGAVLSQTCKAPMNIQIWVPSMANGTDIPERIANQLTAIDALRTGRVDEAFGLLGLSGCGGEVFERHTTPYNMDPQGFKDDLRELIADLRKGGY
jgi:hypothetical protein